MKLQVSEKLAVEAKSDVVALKSDHADRYALVEVIAAKRVFLAFCHIVVNLFLANCDCGCPSSYLLQCLLQLEKVRQERDELELRLREAERHLHEARQRQIQAVKNRETRRIQVQDISELQMLSVKLDEAKERIEELMKENTELRTVVTRRDGELFDELRQLQELVPMLESARNDLQGKVSSTPQA
jgi:DNA repair exonuclease SbcCD ATPase subunit